MQLLDLHRGVRRQRQAGFPKHPSLRLSRVRRAAVEAEPGFRLEERTAPVEEIDNPKRSIEQVDRDFAPCGKAQELPLDRFLFCSDAHGSSRLAAGARSS